MKQHLADVSLTSFHNAEEPEKQQTN